MIEIRNAEILCVGTEILIGDIVNTNAAFISKRLAELGFNQYYQSVVGDNPERLKGSIKESLSRCDLLILTGGLGPTYDDLTKETAAEVLGKKLVLHQDSLDRIKAFFDGRHQIMPETNVKQAMIPDDGVVFANDNGTAPGMAAVDEENGKIVILLPGPPRELIPMFDLKVMPFLRKYSKVTLVSKNINIVGLGESAVEILLREHMKTALNPTIAPYCKEGECRLRVTARASSIEEGEKLCDEEIERIRQTEVGPYIYGIDTDLPTALLETLRKYGNATLATAESCTGGLISKLITDIPGSSDVFLGGAVTYSNQLKMDFLGVKEETLEKYGAVSPECAVEMAQGIRNRCNASVGVSVTGIAGPGGGTPEKPVGLVYTAVDTAKGTVVRQLNFNGSREHIRNLTANQVISLILRQFIH